MYSQQDQGNEKSRNNLTIEVKDRFPSPSPSTSPARSPWLSPTGEDRPLSPLVRSFSPRTYEHESETHVEPVQRPAPRKQHSQQALAAQKRRKRQRLIISLAASGGVLIVALTLGLVLGLTVGRRKHVGSLPAYIPTTIKHTTPENNLMAQMFEWNIPKNATHWVTVANQLQNLKVLGVKDIWIPPATKNANRGAIGYDVYDLWDLGEFDAQGNVSTNMGTKRQLQRLTAKAKDYGIGVVFDAVLNQRTGADEKIVCPAHSVNDTDRLQSTSQTFQMEAWLQFTFPSRKGKYSSKQWSCDDFTAIDINAGTGEKGVWKIEGSDNDFAKDVSNENENYDYLLLADIAYENPSVRADALDWVKWINTELELSGFRLDAAKHLSESFVLEVLNTIKANNGGTDKFFAAEYFTGNLSAMTGYFEALQSRPMMFDTLLLTNFAQFAAGGQTDLGQIFNYTFINEHPEKTVTFVTTHDTQPGQSLAILNVSNWFTPLAYAIILLRKDGLPCLFYGDIYGTYNDYTTIFTPGPYRQTIANLAIARKYWAYGDQTDYLTTSNSTSTIGWTRTGILGDRPDGIAVVLSNGATLTTLRMNVGKQHAGETWSDMTQNIISQTVVIDANGDADFPVRGQSVSVWINEDAVEGRDSLNKFDGDIYGLAPYEIGHATSNYQAIGSAQQQYSMGDSSSSSSSVTSETPSPSPSSSSS